MSLLLKKWTYEFLELSVCTCACASAFAFHWSLTQQCLHSRERHPLRLTLESDSLCMSQRSMGKLTLSVRSTQFSIALGHGC